MSELITSFEPLSLIKAGAGAGKTYHIQKTLTEWVKTNKISADRILAVTFTNAAANEMKERIRLALLQGGLYHESTQVQQSSISTIHGFGLEIIERFAYENGSSPNPRQLTEAEENVLIRLSLTHVEKIVTILNDLSGWGYTGKFNGSEYIEAVVAFKNRVLDVIRKLRDLGVTNNKTQILSLISRAKQATSDIYGETLLNEQTLNQELWNSIQVIRSKFIEPELDREWGSNAGTRNFVKAIFSATEDQISQNWKIWTKLQSIETAPRIFNKKSGELAHPDGQMAFDVWNAADQLSYHPGPLRQSLEHIEILLDSAGDTLLQYQIRKNQAGLVDFGDMVHLAEQLMQDERWLNEIKSKYDCLIIDEFQDTNPLQFALMWGISKAGIPTLIVGDIKQSIMGFQGADSRLFNTLLTQRKNESSELTNNWRSSDGLMVFINDLGKQLFGDQYTNLTPRSKIHSSLTPVKIIDFSEDSWSPGGKKATAKDKAKESFNKEHDNVVVNEIKKLLSSNILVTDKHSKKQRPIRPNDIAVLGPTHKGLGTFAAKLREFGIQPQIKESGWFESDAITWMLYALSYVADPRDQHALMCLKLIKERDSDLQDELLHFISQEKHKTVEGGFVDALDKLSRQNLYTSVKDIIWKTIDALELWEHCCESKLHQTANEISGPQQRANLLKLIQLGQIFEETQSETLQAQGIFGKGLSSFLVWLQENHNEYDIQPHVNSDNKNSVVLKTWFASKGLEWPIVIVIGMEKVREPKLPSVSVQYENDSSADDMLSSAFTQIFTEFDDKNTKEKFLDSLLSSEQDNLRNLTYVVMTRAREQLILPWFNPKKDNCMIALLADMEILDKERIVATVPDTPENMQYQEDQTIRYGRIAIDILEHENAIPDLVSPSSLADIQAENITSYSTIITKNYSNPIDLTLLDKELAANELGTLLHLVYQVMLTQPDLEERLFESIKAIQLNLSLKSLLVDQIASFAIHLEKELSAISWKAEISMLSKTEQGQTLSGVIDLLVETNEGYWIIDHKSDQKTDDEQFNLHLPQLLAYERHLKLNKPILGVAINWVRASKVSYFSHLD